MSRDADAGRWPYEPREPEQAACSAPACTLSTDALRERRDELRRRFWPAVLSVEDVPDGVVLWFERGEERLRELADYALYESECCAFLDFGIGLAAGGSRIALRISAPGGDADGIRRFVHDQLAAATAVS